MREQVLGHCRCRALQCQRVWATRWQWVNVAPTTARSGCDRGGRCVRLWSGTTRATRRVTRRSGPIICVPLSLTLTPGGLPLGGRKGRCGACFKSCMMSEGNRDDAFWLEIYSTSKPHITVQRPLSSHLALVREAHALPRGNWARGFALGSDLDGTSAAAVHAAGAVRARGCGTWAVVWAPSAAI